MKYFTDIRAESKKNLQENFFYIISALKELLEICQTLIRTFEIA
jgi:hypothetical protein